MNRIRSLPMNPAAASMAPYPMRELKEMIGRLRDEGRPVFDFTIGDPIEPTPPFIRRAMLEAVDEVSQYPTVRGRPALRQAAAGWVRRRFNLDLDPDREVLPSSGSKEAIFHLGLLVIDPTSERRAVLFGEPGYPVYERGATLAGGEPMGVPLTVENGFLLEPDSLAPAAADRVAMVWVNYPHNPTGAAATLEDYRRLIAWCRERGAVLCSDECYVDTYFGDDRPPSVLEAAGADRTGVLAFFSCSKRSGMTGYRTGFVAGDPALVASYANVRDGFGTATPEFVQAAAVAAWNDDGHAADRRAVFAAKRAVFDSLFPKVGVETAGSAATFYLWVRCPGGLTGDAYAKHLLNAGIVVTPGASFGPSGEGFVRMALVPTVEQCRQAAIAWQDLEAG